MLAYRMSHPRWPKVDLRLLAYRPQHSLMAHDEVKVVLQSVHNGKPIAESPVAEETMTLLSLCKMLHDDMMDGWERKAECR